MQAEDDSPEIYSKLNDYTLSVVNDFRRMEQADPELRRIFNFKARQVTTIYTMWYCAALTSNMETQKFNDLDSLDEVIEMREKLIRLGGNPPEIERPAHHGKPGLKTPGQR
jgi:hypothetical protein